MTKKEKLSAYFKEYYRKNRDRIQEKIAMRKQDTIEKIAAYQKKYFQDNKEKITKRKQIWYQNNKERLNELARERRKKKFLNADKAA